MQPPSCHWCTAGGHSCEALQCYMHCCHKMCNATNLDQPLICMYGKWSPVQRSAALASLPPACRCGSQDPAGWTAMRAQRIRGAAAAADEQLQADAQFAAAWQCGSRHQQTQIGRPSQTDTAPGRNPTTPSTPHPAPHPPPPAPAAPLPQPTLVSSMTAHMILVFSMALRRLFRVSCGGEGMLLPGSKAWQP